MTIDSNIAPDVEDSDADEFDSEVSYVGGQSKLLAYNKFVVALVGLAVTIGLIDNDVAQGIAGVLTALGVFLVPNIGA